MLSKIKLTVLTSIAIVLAILGMNARARRAGYRAAVERTKREQARATLHQQQEIRDAETDYHTSGNNVAERLRNSGEW